VGKDEQRRDDQNKNGNTSMDDNEIIRRILEGEKNLYSLIIQRYNQRLYWVGLSIVDRQSEIEDVMQSAYLKAYENLGKFKFQSSFSTWLTKILVNESLRYLRKRKRISSRNERNFAPGLEHDSMDLQTPLVKMLNSELKAILEMSIRSLPEKYRTVFIMRQMENRSVSETMGRLELTESNVKVRLNRAKIMLRNKLNAYVEDDEILQLCKSHCDPMVDPVMDE
jgi:RNA polymerase sigma factor (sigma-70 family)